jgi:DNA-binding transcriptional regulator YiaG
MTQDQTAPLRGRPKKPDAKTTAEVSKEYRQNLKSEGKKAINVYLPTGSLAVLARICKAKSMTMAEAVEWAIGEAIAYDAVKKSSEPSKIHGLHQKTIREKLVDARIAVAFTEAEMADRIQAPLSRYQKWEGGRERIPKKYLDAVIEQLNLPDDYFAAK